MKLYNFLNEELNKKEISEEFINLLKKDCSDYLKIWNNNLYRRC